MCKLTFVTIGTATFFHEISAQRALGFRILVFIDFICIIMILISAALTVHGGIGASVRWSRVRGKGTNRFHRRTK